MRFKSVPIVAIIFLLITLLALGLPAVNGVNKVIANSADWRDVYSSMLYASLIGKGPGAFLTSTSDGTIILYTIPTTTNGTLIVSSNSQPYVVNYKSLMDSKGYTNVEEIVTGSANLDLAKRLAAQNGQKKFIIVDDAYGYDALSAAPYAVKAGYYVLFTNDRNIAAVDSFLSGISPQSIIIFGQVDESVKSRLAKYNPQTLNEGDRFNDNIEMVKMYEQIDPSKQVLMSDGSFIESSLMSGDDPVVYIGQDTVPIQVQNYIQQAGFQVAVLVGNELINTATQIRRQLGISVFVKFAQGSRTPTGPISTVQDLDRFPMPSYQLSMNIYSIMFNTATQQLWVTYKNNAGIGTYIKGTITLSAGDQKIVVGDQNPVFIDKNQYKTVTYDAKISGSEINASVYALFGESTQSLNYVLQGLVSVQNIEILDNSSINMTNVAYDKGKQRFIITIQNNGSVDAYVSIEMLDLYVNGEYVTVSSPQSELVHPGETINIPVDVALTDSDIANNPTVKVEAYYGEHDNSLIKTIYGEYAFKYVSFDIVTYVLIGLIIALLLLILLGKKRKCPNCNAKNPLYRKNCSKCGKPLSNKHQKKNSEKEREERLERIKAEKTTNETKEKQ